LVNKTTKVPGNPTYLSQFQVKYKLMGNFPMVSLSIQTAFYLPLCDCQNVSAWIQIIWLLFLLWPGSTCWWLDFTLFNFNSIQGQILKVTMQNSTWILIIPYTSLIVTMQAKDTLLW